MITKLWRQSARRSRGAKDNGTSRSRQLKFESLENRALLASGLVPNPTFLLAPASVAPHAVSAPATAVFAGAWKGYAFIRQTSSDVLVQQIAITINVDPFGGVSVNGTVKGLADLPNGHWTKFSEPFSATGNLHIYNTAGGITKASVVVDSNDVTVNGSAWAWKSGRTNIGLGSGSFSASVSFQVGSNTFTASGSGTWSAVNDSRFL